MNRREFISYGIGGAAAALASCATKGVAGDEIKNVRAESPERQAAKMRALESAQELLGCTRLRRSWRFPVDIQRSPR